MAAVKLHNIVKVFGEFVAIKGVNLEIDDGSFVVFVGPSGCGKTTLLRMIAGLETISYGDLEIAGRNVNDMPSRERGISMVFQSYALFPHMTVRDNLGFGLKMSGTSKDVIAKRVNSAAEMLGLGPNMDRRPSQLSGGQRQRVAIGRAVVREPLVFLFDEPLSNLDAKLRNQTRVEIKQLQRKLGATVIFVTHDQIEAMTLADKIVVLKDGEVAQSGTPMDVFERPQNKFVAGFIGAPSMNFLEGVLGEVDGKVAVHIGKSSLLIDSDKFNLPEQGASIAVGIRPEDIVPDGHGQRPAMATKIQSTVRFAEMLGNESLVYCNTPAGKIVSRMPRPEPLEGGEILTMHIDCKRIHLFDPISENSLLKLSN